MRIFRIRTAASLIIVTSALCQAPISSGATMDARAVAASAAADGPNCSGLSFYWEIGTSDGDFRGGQRIARFGKPVFRHSQGPVASASKWLYATYAIERSGGALDPVHDEPMLNFTSGYDELKACGSRATVEDCGHSQRAPLNPASQGRFSYSPAHMQHHAATDQLRSLGTSKLTATALGPAIGSTLGILPNTRVPNPVKERLQPTISIGLKYSGPVLGSDAAIDAGTYAVVLQRILSGSVKMRNYLGSNPICASDAVDSHGRYLCSSDGGFTPNVGYVPPIPAELVFGSSAHGTPWQYSVGHWIESDGTYSAAGAFGFYPWIDKDKLWYGIVAQFSARTVMAYQQSLICGRAIRDAWLGVP